MSESSSFRGEQPPVLDPSQLEAVTAARAAIAEPAELVGGMTASGLFISIRDQIQPTGTVLGGYAVYFGTVEAITAGTPLSVEVVLLSGMFSSGETHVQIPTREWTVQLNMADAHVMGASLFPPDDGQTRSPDESVPMMQTIFPFGPDGQPHKPGESDS